MWTVSELIHTGSFLTAEQTSDWNQHVKQNNKNYLKDFVFHKNLTLININLSSTKSVSLEMLIVSINIKAEQNMLFVCLFVFQRKRIDVSTLCCIRWVKGYFN